MKITKKQLRKLITESIKPSDEEGGYEDNQTKMVRRYLIQLGIGDSFFDMNEEQIDSMAADLRLMSPSQKKLRDLYDLSLSTEEWLSQREDAEELEKAHKHPLARGLQVVRTGKEVTPGIEGESEDVATIYYDIKNEEGEVVGNLEYNDYFGNLDGELYGRYLPELRGYRSHGSGPLGKLQSFFKSKTGRKWLDVSQRQMGR